MSALSILNTGHALVLTCSIVWHPQALSVIATGGSVLTLTEWIIVFMVFNLLIAQYPHMHSLRFVNSAATFSTIAFSAIAVGLSLYSGESCQRWSFTGPSSVPFIGS